ncbi:uncharacterized protein [Triticum aestivum]|uniref:uncharacterized protein n=1 Tax=Triticum aestivum TaxID=4565 RepID=UPI001D009979|nr:uncharacterized protein LOC123116341 [Triticum aestivum]
MTTSSSSCTPLGESSSSPPVSPMATSPSSSTPVGESSSSPPVKLVAMKENTCQPVDQVGGRLSALVFRDLPGEQKSSSDLSDASESDEGSEIYDTDHVLAWRDRGLPTPVYVRMDSSGVFYTYPTLGDKPLQSLEEVASAVDSYANPNSNVMSDKMLSEKERAVRERLYFPDGTPKVYTRAQVVKRERDKVRRLVEALLDKRNDAEDRVDELEEIVHWQSICKGVEWYYHLNITVKTKGAADDAGSTSLFFVEVACDSNDITGYYINTFSRVDTDGQDRGATCNGCINNESDGMKHPRAASFKGGHMNIGFPLGFGPCNEKQWVDSRHSEAQYEEMLKKEEERIRDHFEFIENAEHLRRKHLSYRWEYQINLQSDEEIASDSDEE